MHHYRVVARSVWNTAFWPFPERRNWDARDQFDQIKGLLFKALAIARLEAGERGDLNLLQDRVLWVVPLEPGPVPIMIERPRAGDRGHYWDDPVKEIRASDAKLQFLDYFDWNLMAAADFHYYRVRITSSTAQPHLADREVLLQHNHAKVYAEE
jgi:hypothetical protein